jgi:hypothetical protein
VDDGEFDVVKKRRMMDDAQDDQEDTSSEEALMLFEEFERNVLPALERIQEDEYAFRRREMVEFEEDMLQGGGVYFAWSSCLGCMKIGATRRDSPDQRLREISRYVTEMFVLVAWIPTPKPFKLEAAAHQHFDRQRINSRSGGTGAGTEFFRITSVEAAEWAGRHVDGETW